MESRKTLLLAVIFSPGLVLFVCAGKLLLGPPEPVAPVANEPGEVIIWRQGQPLP